MTPKEDKEEAAAAKKEATAKKKPDGVWLKNPGGKVVLVSADHSAVQIAKDYAKDPRLAPEGQEWELAEEPDAHPYGKESA